MQIVAALESLAGGVLALTALETPRVFTDRDAAGSRAGAELEALARESQEEGAPPATEAEKEPELADPEVVAKLLEQHGEAERAKEATPSIASLERMAAFANPEFVAPALEALKYRASKADKAAAKAEAEELGDASKERVEELALAREAAVAVAGARVLAMHSDPKVGKALLAAFLVKGLTKTKPLAAAAIVDAMGRSGFREAQAAVFEEFQRHGDERVLRACTRYFGQVKTTSFDAVRALCEELAAPEPADVDSALNPPASYWEERWKKWQAIRRDASWSLREITGQTFQPAESEGPGDSRRALEYVREHRRELGLQ